MPEKPKKYKIVISKDALLDIKSTKKYILDTFQISGICGKLFKEDQEGNQGTGFLPQRL